jgi:lipopolysaccharide/colanic/teichoic acid biosynthesis glycosyltransferase
MPALQNRSDRGFQASAPASVRISDWNYSLGKRLMDLGFAGLTLVATFPMALAVAALVKCTSRGPILFRQTRVGKDGRSFQLMKFRTMTQSEKPSGPQVTQKGDPRITRIGRFLRQFKLDELPQLLHVISGEMSLVGPRPDVPEFWAAADITLREALRLKPGLTGWATLHFRNEEERLAGIPAAEIAEVYINQILPEKAALDLEYAQRATLSSDLKIMFQTAFAVFS